MIKSFRQNPNSEIGRDTTNRIDRLVDPSRDHILGNQEAEMTLVEYGSYACPSCQEAHNIVINLRDRFGDQLRYVFRHKPLPDNKIAEKAALLAEYAGDFYGKFWEVHDALMKRGTSLDKEDFDIITDEFDLPNIDQVNFSNLTVAYKHVQEDIIDAKNSDVILTPTFFINDRRYEGPWDESSLSEALIGSLGHRFHTATLDFVRWGPSAGVLLLIMSLVAIILTNSFIGSAYIDFWNTPLGLTVDTNTHTLTLREWVNNGLLSLFFLVVGLEIKLEFTIGRLSTRQTAALPIAASFGGVIAPALIYLTIIPSGPLSTGWGVAISTDTAFAIALIVMLGARVPVELRVFLTATAIVDDVISIAVIAIFYSYGINTNYLLVSLIILLILLAFNKWNFYKPAPYVILGFVLWVCLHQAGLHPTLAGIVIALIIPAKPPTNLRALNAQAQALFKTEALFGEEQLMRNSPSPQALRILDTIHDHLESPAAKLLRTVEPWSSYLILPIFALANAGVVLSYTFQKDDFQLMLAIFLGLVIGKPVGIFICSWLATQTKLAVKPAEYTWRQLLGAGVLAGMGFTMSLFIGAHSFPIESDLSASKIAVFVASITAAISGSWILYRRTPTK
jgi:NhaA family Na+:H+ antiporter